MTFRHTTCRAWVPLLGELPVERRWRFLLTVARLLRDSGWRHTHKGVRWTAALRRWDEARRAGPAREADEAGT